MNSTDDTFELLLENLISIPLYLIEKLCPSKSQPSDFIPKYKKYTNDCFYLTFPCRNYQLIRRELVIDFWNNTCFIDHNDEFVFVEAINLESPLSQLTIRFRPRVTNNTVINNFYNSNVNINTQINNYQIKQVKKIQQYFQNCNDLENDDKNEYINTLNDMINKKSPDKDSLNKLWNYIIKSKDIISTVADVVGIIGFFMPFFSK